MNTCLNLNFQDEYFDAREEDMSSYRTNTTIEDSYESYVTAIRDDSGGGEGTGAGVSGEGGGGAAAAAACASSAMEAVTAAEPIEAEPIEDDEDHHLHDSQIPTIRLSSLGIALEQDFHKVRAELGASGEYSENSEASGTFSHEHFSDEFTSRINLQANNNSNNNNSNSNSIEIEHHHRQQHPPAPSHLHHPGLSPPSTMTMNKSKSFTKVVSESNSSDSTTSSNNPATLSPNESEEIVVMEEGDHPIRGGMQQQQQRPQLRRCVSGDGVIAEFDLNGGDVQYGSQPDEINVTDDVLAQAIEIDASFRSMSIRDMEDLELGDVEPLPYPGRRSTSSGATATNPSSRISGSIFNRSSVGSAASAAAMGPHGGRAELLSATVIKNSPNEQIGINLLREETVVYSIERGEEEDEGSSLLRHCPFQAGDRLLSVNNKRTQHLDSAEVARILGQASGFITIVVHNPGGDPCLIETMITKANRNQRSGMGLKSTGSRDLRVSSINENGLFAQSLLNVGDRILSINEVDVTEVDARVACDIIKNAPDRVTVVARTAHTTGVVVAEVSTRGLRNSFNGEQMLTAVPESGDAASGTNRDEIEAFDDAFQLSKQQREQFIIGLCLILIVVAVLAGLFGRDSDEQQDTSN